MGPRGSHRETRPTVQTVQWGEGGKCPEPTHLLPPTSHHVSHGLTWLEAPQDEAVKSHSYPCSSSFPLAGRPESC